MPSRGKRSHADNDDDHVDEIHQADVENDDDEVDNDHRSTKTKKKVRIMGASGQSEADRRVLRRRQRELHQEIVSGGGDTAESVGGVEGPTSGEFQRMREKNNELWDQVRFTREAVLDSENMDLITAKAARQVEKIVQVPRYDAVRLAQNLAKKSSIRTPSGSFFGWRGLGFQVGVCFNALPSNVSFLHGPIEASYQPKERKKPERKARQRASSEDNGEEEKPDDVDQTKGKQTDGNELSAVETHIRVIHKTLKKRCQEESDSASERHDAYVERISQEVDDERALQSKKKKFMKESGQVDAVKCLFNPNSFTQTVENIFHFSFLVRNNKAGIRARTVEEAEEFGGAGPGPVIRPVPERDLVPAPKQAIVSLTMRDWKDMCYAYGVTESDVPHRTPKKKGRNPSA